MGAPILMLGNTTFYVVTGLGLLGAAGVALFLIIVSVIEKDSLTK